MDNVITKAYLYKWAELSTGKWYIGSRTAKGCHPDDGYICSSKSVLREINDNSLNWCRQVLVIGESEYIYELEGKLLSELNAKMDPMSFNKHNNDCVYSGKFVRFAKGAVPWNKGLATELQPYFGKKHTEANKTLYSKQKIGINNPAFGKEPWNKGIEGLVWYNNGTKSIQCTPDNVPEGFVEGRIYEKRWYNNGVVSIQAVPGEEQEGFIPGRKIGWTMKYDKTAYHWYNNGLEAKRFIPGTEPSGFVIGRKVK
jgi:hypothetical protein